MLNSCFICAVNFLDRRGSIRIVKELVLVDLDTLETKQWLFLPPYEVSFLPESVRQINSGLGSNVYNIHWDRGDVPYNDLHTILTEAVAPYKHVYTAGFIHLCIFRPILGHAIIDLSSMDECPKARTLVNDREQDVECCFPMHTEKQFVGCAKRMALHYSKWCRDNCDITDMTKEEARLKTFKTFPHAEVSHKELAQAGFYYTRSEDATACAFCKLTLRNWEEGDVVAKLHSSFNPFCRFARSLP